jgi:flagellar hook-associated protein 2
LQSVRTQVRNFISNPSDTPGSTVSAARHVGLSFDRNGVLQLDEDKLSMALQDNFDEVVQMFSAGTNNQSVFSPAPAGLAGRAVRSIDQMLRSTGLVDKQSATAQKKITEYQKDMEKLQERMDKLLARYMNQFSAMESIVGSSNSLRTSLKGSFEGMMNIYKN